MKEKKFLPIGTIVRTSDDSNLLMITGYFMYDDNNGIERYDYATCKYPYGVLFTKSIKGINHNDINEIIYEGYRNNASEALNEKLAGAISDIKMSNSSTNVFFDENGVVVTDASQKSTEDDEYLTMLENSQISNPFISYNEEEKEINEIPQESDKWPIFKNIQFDDDGNVTEAEEYDDNTNIVPGIEFDKNGVVMSFEEKKPTPSNTLRFDENGNVVDDGAEEKITTNNTLRFDENGNVVADGAEEKKDLSGIEFDENGFVISFVGEKPKLGDSLKFDENGRVIAEEKEKSEQELDENITNIKFDEKGYVILDEKPSKDEIITIDDEF